MEENIGLQENLNDVESELSALRPRVWNREFENTLKLIFKVFKDKYGIVLDSEINLPRVISGKKSFYYVLFAKIEGADKVEGKERKETILPLLRIFDELSDDNNEGNMYYTCLETTLRFLTTDAGIKEIFDKAVTAQQPVQEGNDSPDLRKEPLRPEDAIDPKENVGGESSTVEKETKSKK